MKQRFFPKQIILVAGVIGLLGGCVRPAIVKPVEGLVDFKEFKAVRVVVMDWVETPYSKGGIPMLEGLLKGKLNSLGYTSVDTDEDLLIDIRVTRFEPGSEAVRFFVGFGAGRALLAYTASFRDKLGNLVTEMEGGKAYTGMEFGDNPLLKTNEEIQMGMIVESVMQISRFIENNGKLEERPDP